MRKTVSDPTLGVRVQGPFDTFLRKMTNLYNFKTGKSISRSDIIRMCLERGAPVLAEEFKKQFGETVELIKGADVSKFGMAHENGRVGWKLKQRADSKRPR